MPRAFCWAVTLLLAIGRPVGADPLTITSGFVIFTDEPGEFALAGSGFDLRGWWFPQTLNGTFWYDRCQLCAAGTAIDFGTTTYGISNLGDGGSVGGVPYPGLFYDGQLTFTGPFLTAPLRLNEDAATRRSGPFEFEGRIAVFANESFAGTPLFSARLRGSGTAHVFFGSDYGPHGPFLFGDLVYTFQQQAPIPEPATVLLMGAGLATAIGRRVAHRRRR